MIKANRLQIDTTNLTDYQASQVRRPMEGNYVYDTSGISNLLSSHNSSVTSVDNKKRMMLKRDTAILSNKDLNLNDSRKYQTNETKDSDTSIAPLSLSSNFMKMALQEVQKSAREEGSSTGRNFTKNGVDEYTKLRDLRSIFYKQASLLNNCSEKTSARNKSSSKMLSKNSSKSLKASRMNSSKNMAMAKKNSSPGKDDLKKIGYIEEKHHNNFNITNAFSKSKSLLRGSKSRKREDKA